MRLHAMALLAVFAAGLALAGPARAETTVSVLETFPSGDDVVLGGNQSFYLRLEYRTDTSVRIWVQPYFRGKPADAGSNPSQTYTGTGEAFGWFFLMRPGDEVDEVRIKAGDGSLERTPVVATLRVHVVGGDAPAQAREPDWVTEKKSQVAEAERRDYQARMNTPLTGGDMALVGGFMLAVAVVGLGVIVLPVWALRRWRGGWRLAALAPTAAIAFVALRLVIDVSRDPTSHNLWPFEILMTGVPCLVVLVVLAIARKVTGAGRTSTGVTRS